MALVTVADTLYFIDKPSVIQVWDTDTLQYVEISELLSAPYGELSSDKLSFTVTPVDQVGKIEYKIGLVTGQEYIIPCFFKSNYYKQEFNIDDYTSLFPVDFLRFYDEDPDTAVFESLSTLTNDAIPKGTALPISNYMNRTFPEYCSNQLIGIGMCLAYNNYLINGTRQVIEVRQFELDDIATSIVDYIGTSATSVSDLDPETGLYKKVVIPVFDNEYNSFSVKYGANSNKEVTYYQRAIFLRNLAISEITPELVNWKNAEGVPINCEVFYQDLATNTVFTWDAENIEASWDEGTWGNAGEAPSDEGNFPIDEYTEYKIPTFKRFQGDNYQPDVWINSLSFEDNRDNYFTWDSDNPEEFWDEGIWGGGYETTDILVSYDGTDFSIFIKK